MLTRTTRTRVTFSHPFFLGDATERFPAGRYDVETDEELLQGLSFTAYRRVLTTVHLHDDAGKPGLQRSIAIRPEELDIAMAQDVAMASTPRPELPVRDVDGADGDAVRRAENEGMAVVDGPPWGGMASRA